ncbi:LPS-assembly lipoprotein LptE [Marinobacter sp. OP 3.4]|uniref:LPS-assembly lipoprotein LptE n=1 Tax=Marinobacter sp. OP 3.4 TaxID=3076501 RepID=UPI002E1E5478
MKQLRHATTLALLTLLVSACGFQLRGASPVPSALQPIWVGCHDGVPTELCNSLKSQFTIGDVQLADSREEAAHLLLLGDFRQNQRTSAITAQAEAAEYELRQTVSVVLQTREGIPLLPETEVSASQSYRFDSTSVLAKRREREEIERQLYDSLVRQIGYRLVSFDQERIDEILEATKDQQQKPSQ